MRKNIVYASFGQVQVRVWDTVFSPFIHLAVTHFRVNNWLPFLVTRKDRVVNVSRITYQTLTLNRKWSRKSERSWSPVLYVTIQCLFKYLPCTYFYPFLSYWLLPLRLREVLSLGIWCDRATVFDPETPCFDFDQLCDTLTCKHLLS